MEPGKYDLIAGKKLSCKDTTELLYLFVCDELPDAEAQQVSAHLFNCKHCRTALAETVRIAGVLSTVMPRMPQQYFSVNN